MLREVNGQFTSRSIQAISPASPGEIAPKFGKFSVIFKQKFLVAFFSAATRHAGVLSSSRLLRTTSGFLFQMLSWPGSFLPTFFLVLGIRFQNGAKIPKRCNGLHFVDLGESGEARVERVL